MTDAKALMEVWVERMKALQSKDGDTEIQHSEADGILCEVLLYLGAKELVAEWEKVPKWYA